MLDNRRISLCIPTWDRFEMLFESFSKVHNDERISEIVIVDDASEVDIFKKVFNRCLQYPKISLKRNLQNRDCYENKMTAISYASNDWVIILDSDNIIDTDYLDKIFAIPDWDENIIYAPDYAMPTFDYRAFGGHTISQHNVAGYMNQNLFSTALNTFNFFINKNQYLSVWDGSINPHTGDSIYFNYCWLKSGKKINFVEGLQYFHRIHAQSHFQINNHKTGNFISEIEQKLKQLV